MSGIGFVTSPHYPADTLTPNPFRLELETARRYCLNQQALIFVILSLTAFLAASFCSVAIWEMGVRISIIFGSLLLLSGFALTIRDILESDKTLWREIEFAESSSCSDDSGRGPGSNPIQG
jgi:hypothetical protein